MREIVPFVSIGIIFVHFFSPAADDESYRESPAYVPSP